MPKSFTSRVSFGQFFLSLPRSCAFLVGSSCPSLRLSKISRKKWKLLLSFCSIFYGLDCPPRRSQCLPAKMFVVRVVFESTLTSYALLMEVVTWDSHLDLDYRCCCSTSLDFHCWHGSWSCECSGDQKNRDAWVKCKYMWRHASWSSSCCWLPSCVLLAISFYFIVWISSRWVPSGWRCGLVPCSTTILGVKTERVARWRGVMFCLSWLVCWSFRVLCWSWPSSCTTRKSQEKRQRRGRGRGRGRMGWRKIRVVPSTRRAS